MHTAIITLLSAPDIAPIHAALFLSYIAIAVSWLYALSKIWKFRRVSGANHALSGAIAMVLSMAVLIFQIPVSYSTLAVFLAVAQFIIVLSYTRLLGLSPTHYQLYSTKMEKAETYFTRLIPTGQRGSPGMGSVRRCYIKVMFFLGVLGIVGAVISMYLHYVGF